MSSFPTWKDGILEINRMNSKERSLIWRCQVLYWRNDIIIIQKAVDSRKRGKGLMRKKRDDPL